MTNAPAERVSYGDDENQFMDLWWPDANLSGAAAFIHGGFWRAKYDHTHADPFCAALAGKGIAVANLEYRRVGQPGGGWPGTFQDVIAAVEAASAHLRRTPVVIGHSAGGHLALRLAAESVALQAVIALAPVADLRRAYEMNLSSGAVAEFLGSNPEVSPGRYNEACPSTHLSRLRRVIVHGTEDEVVPIAISEAFIAKRKDDPEPPNFMKISGANHMDLIDPASTPGSAVLDLVVRLARE